MLIFLYVFQITSARKKNTENNEINQVKKKTRKDDLVEKQTWTLLNDQEKGILMSIRDEWKVFNNNGKSKRKVKKQEKMEL